MKKRNENGFTLIELLAVIIILGVLMIIAVPSVTKYIDSSRKNGYVSTARGITTGVRNQVHSGSLDMNDPDTTYYVEGNCIKTDNEYKSPYGEFEKSYVVVAATNDGHDYYWMGVDKTGTGVKTLKNVDILESDDIESYINVEDITPSIGVDKRSKIVVVGGDNCTKSDPIEPAQVINSMTGRVKGACPSTYTETIYWALQDTNSDGINDKLVLSDSEVEGALSGNIPGNGAFTHSNLPPWVSTRQPMQPSNLSHNVSQIEIIGKVVPASLAYYFTGVGYGVQTLNFELNNLETCLATSMEGTFTGVGYESSSARIDIRDWDTSKVTNMYGTFIYFAHDAASCIIDGLEYLDTSKVTNMNGTLGGICQSVPTLNVDLRKWNTSSATNMSGLLAEAGLSSQTVNINLSNWNTSKVTNMMGVFSAVGEESSSVNINVSNWDTSNVTNMNNMFSYVGVEATTWNVIGLKDFNTSKVTNMSAMFISAGYSTSSITLDLSRWNTSKVTDMNNMFAYLGGTSSTVNLDISTWDTSKVTNMRYMFLDAGANADTVNVIIPRTNGNSIENTTAKLYGKTTNTSASLPNGKLFTLAE